MAANSVEPGIYRHFKGNEYRVLGTVKHSESHDTLVLYQALYGDKGYWVRPLSMFTEKVERDGKQFDRFSLVSPTESPL